jgi:hypothetical protein
MSLTKTLLSGLASSHPLVRVAAKYWWLALPAGWAMWTLSKKRDKIDAAGIITDFGICFGPVLPIILLGEMIAERESRQQGAVAGIPPASVSGLGLQGAKDAQFVVSKPVPTPQFMAGG